MIFVTVGNHTQTFTRLIKSVDVLVGKGVLKEVFIQTGYSDYTPKNCKYKDFMEYSEFQSFIKKSYLVITHGGGGVIATALINNKKVIVVPRLKKFREHTNDHQLQLTRALEKEGRIIEVYDINKLEDAIDRSKTFRPRALIKESSIIELIEEYVSEVGLISYRINKKNSQKDILVS